jgi:tetratricopeptide (TPR) repeat protein
MKRLITLTSVFIQLGELSAIPLPQQSQPPSIHGQVVLHNSRTKTGTIQYVQGASLIADSASPTTSDRNGGFTLAFEGKRNMTHAHVRAEKHSLVVVNTRDLQDVTIGGEAPLRVFMADSAEREQALLLDINLKVLTAEKDALIARLRGDSAVSRVTLTELSERFGREFEHRWAAEDYLNAQLEGLKERLPERVAEMARVNLDFASERYRRAYGFYRVGDVEPALVVLDSANLEREVVAVDQSLGAIAVGHDHCAVAKDSLRLVAGQIVASYQLKAEAHGLRFEYRKAAGVLEKGLGLLLRVKLGKEDLEAAYIYGKLGSLYRDAADYPKALKSQESDLTIKQRLLDPNDPSLATSYHDLALIHKDMSDYAKAMAAQQRAIAIQEKALGPDHPGLAISYNNLAMIYSKMSDYSKALVAQQKAHVIREKVLDLEHPDLATSYNTLAMIYRDMGEYLGALAAQQKAIAIWEKAFGPEHPYLATFYHTLALILQSMGDYLKALEAQQRAIAIREKVLGFDHPDLGISYRNIASTFASQGQIDTAIVYNQRALAILRKKLPPQHPYIASAEANGAHFHRLNGDRFYGSLDYQKAIDAYSMAYCLDSVEATYLDNTGIIFAKLGDFQKAKSQLVRLERLQPDSCLSFRAWAVYYALMGDLEKSLDNLEKAIQLGYNDWEWIKTEEALGSIRNTDRYKTIMKGK